MDNVKGFFDAVTSDADLRGKLEAVNARYKDEELTEEARDRILEEDVIPLAAQAGFVFTMDDLKEYNDQKPLSDDELSAVAGGSVDEWSTCLCVAGGGGTNKAQGITCACVLGGGGKKDSEGLFMVCAVMGTVIRDGV